MLTSIALIFILGMFLAFFFEKLRLPGLIGMIMTGIILGPCVLNMLDPSLLSISADLRQFALVIILTRAGLSLNIEDLKKVGRPAVMMCFVPACFEIAGTAIIAPHFFNISFVDALIVGSVIAAVSPAVIVPRMIKIIQDGYGQKNSIPQLILAGSSVDDVFVIVMFTAFTGIAAGGSFSATSLLQIPVSITLGILAGIICGKLISKFFKKFISRDIVKVIMLLSVSFLLIELENDLKEIVPFSGLLAIMSIGLTMFQTDRETAKKLSAKYNSLWVGAEVILFVLVGATVDLAYVRNAGIAAIGVVVFALIFRMCGVFSCLLGTKLEKREKIFCMLAYTPKATVQAAIGSIPLAMGLSCGSVVLTIAVVSILLTAPFGAICVDRFYPRLLKKDAA